MSHKASAVVAGAALLATASLLVAHALGYDAWAWMVWARQLAHGHLNTAGGPAFKPLPVLVVAPFVRLGDAAPLIWLAAMRTAALSSLVVAYRLGARLAGPVAGVTAAALIAMGPDVYRTALYGSSEPLLVLLLLLAATRWAERRPRPALALLGVAGLLRPELWPIVVALAVLLTRRERRLSPLVAVAALAPPAVWLGLTWIGSGTFLGEFRGVISIEGCIGCATIMAVPRATVTVNEHTTFIGVLAHLTEALPLPALVLAGIAVVDRRTRSATGLIALVAIAWIVTVGAMAQIGYPGSRRYLVAPAALLAIVAGVGVVQVLLRAHSRRARVAAGAVIAATLIASYAPELLLNARLISVARRQQQNLEALRVVVDRAGGPAAVRAAGGAVVNPWVQTALAWDLGVDLDQVRATWHSTRREPGWKPPALVFRGPTKLSGPRPAVSRHRRGQIVVRQHRWDVFAAPLSAANPA